jgi:hypothetical protein
MWNKKKSPHRWKFCPPKEVSVPRPLQGPLNPRGRRKKKLITNFESYSNKCNLVGKVGLMDSWSYEPAHNPHTNELNKKI